MNERRQSLIAIRSVQLPLIVQTIATSFILINGVLLVSFLTGGGIDPGSRVYLGLAVGGVELVAVVIVLILARRQTNRIAGPIYRLSQFGEQLGTGDLTARLKVRDGDFFQDQLDVIDGAIQEFRQRIDQAKRTLASTTAESNVDQARQTLEWFQTEEENPRT